MQLGPIAWWLHGILNLAEDKTTTIYADCNRPSGGQLFKTSLLVQRGRWQSLTVASEVISDESFDGGATLRDKTWLGVHGLRRRMGSCKR